MRLYNDTDYEIVMSWITSRGMKPIPKKYLPEIGVIHEGVSVGFLQTTNTPIAYLEFFIANPDKPKNKREDSIKSVATKLIDIAKNSGIDIVMMSSKIPTIQQYARNLGFQEKVRSKVSILELSNDVPQLTIK